MESPLYQLAGMAWLSKSIAVAAQLEIADHLESGPVSHTELAAATQTHPDALLYLLRTVGMAGIFREEDGRFANSELSEPLRANHPESLRNWCMLAGGMYYDAWGGLLHTVQTGRPAADKVFGVPLYEALDRDPEAADVFDKAMQDLVRPIANWVGAEYDFSGVQTVFDVGGGNGGLLKQLLPMHPELRGISLDRADVCERATKALHESDDKDLIERLSFQAADIFGEIPGGGDLYVIKNVLHDWESANCVRILTGIREAMVLSAAAEVAGRPDDFAPRLLIIDPLAEQAKDMAVHSLFKMVINEEGTREWTADQLRQLVAEAGLEVRSLEVLPSGHGVLDCALLP